MVLTVNGLITLNTPPLGQPQGRLTLTTAVPVLTGAVATSATVRYTPAVGRFVPIWNGSTFVMQPFAELTNTLANAGNAGPAAGAAAKVYDMFVASLGGVLTLVRDVAWTNDTTPVGSSTAPRAGLTMVQGVLVNESVIATTISIPAGYATYVGTIATDAGGATVTYNRGSSATNGGAAVLGVWNCYNRTKVECAAQDSTAGWSYTTGTFRSANNSATNRITMVRGLDEDGVTAHFTAKLALLGGATFTLALALDSTGAASGLVSSQPTTTSPAALTTTASPTTTYSDLPGLGRHYIQALEAGDGANATGVDMRYGGLFASLMA